MHKKPLTEQVGENVQHAIEQVQEEVAGSYVPSYRASRRTQILAFIYLLAFAVFALLAWFVHIHPVLPIDVAITKEFQENRATWLQVSMIAVSYLGNYFWLFAPLILLTAIAFWVVRLRLEALFIVALSIISYTANFLLKLLVSRPRPTAGLVTIFQGATGQSFPSGHVMSYIAFWGLLLSLSIILFKRDRWWHYALLIISTAFVVLIGPSRIYLGDHWASDVLGGYLFGGLLLGIVMWIYLKLKSKGILTSEVKPREAA